MRCKPRCPPSGYIKPKWPPVAIYISADLDDFTGNWGTCKRSSLHVVVPLLTYLLMNNTPEEVNALAIDVVFAGVDTVSNN